jgi:hypothetical protein
MAREELRAWIAAVVALAGYTAYLTIVLARWDGGPLTGTDYVPVLLWTVGASVAAAVVLETAATITARRDGTAVKDERDREINRLGEYVGQSFLAVGGITALILAMAEADHFWIANALNLAFVLSALLGSLTKIVSYRWGFQPW